MLDVYYEVWDVIAVWLILYPDFMMCCFYICSLFFFHVFLCTNFKNQELHLLDPRWSPLERFGNVWDSQVWEASKNIGKYLSPRVPWSPQLPLKSTTIHYPNLTFWRSYGHIFIDSVISIPSMFFYLWGCWKSHNPLIPRLFCVARRFGIWECDIWSPLWTCFVYSILVPLNEKFGLAMWSLKPDGLFSYEYWTKLGVTKVALRGHGVAITAKPIGAYPKMIPKTMP